MKWQKKMGPLCAIVLLMGCIDARSPDVVQPRVRSTAEKLAATATADYSQRLAENLERMSQRLQTGEVLSEEQVHLELSQGAQVARQEAFKKVNEFLQQELSQTEWDQKRAAELFAALATGHRRIKP